MNSTFTVLAILSFVCCANSSHLSLSSSKAFDDLLHRLLDMVEKAEGIRENPEIYSKVREIRETGKAGPENYAYVESDLNSCSYPSDSIRNFCGLTGSSPTLKVRRQSKTVELIVSTFSAIQATVGYTCSNAVKTILCKGGYPECSSDSSTATYSNFASDCGGLSSCSAGAASLNGQSGAQLCSFSGKSFSLTTCAKYSMNSLNPVYCQRLPYNITFPTWVMSELSTQGVGIANLKTSLDNAGVSSSCTRQWTRIACLNVPFCSSDRRKLLGVITRDECESALNCLPSSARTLLRRLYDCNMFPDRNGQKYAVPPGHGFTGRAWPVAMGTFLLYAICSFLCYVI